MLGQRRNAPLARFRTGGAGTLLALVLVVYTLAQAGFYGFGPYWFVQPTLDANSFPGLLFHRWMGLKPLVLLAVLLADILQASVFPLFAVLAFVVLAGGVVGSAGTFLVLALAGPGCNTLGGTSGAVVACHDPRYCCVFAGQNALCPADTGPCGAGSPQVAADLQPSTDYLLLQWFALGFLVAEVLIFLLMIPVYNIRARKKANYELLVQDAQLRVFGGTLLEGAEDGTDLLTATEAEAETAALTAEAESAQTDGREDALTVAARFAYAHAHRHVHGTSAHADEVPTRLPALPAWLQRGVRTAGRILDELCEHVEGSLPQEAVYVQFAHPDGKHQPIDVPVPAHLLQKTAPEDRPRATRGGLRKRRPTTTTAQPGSYPGAGLPPPPTDGTTTFTYTPTPPPPSITASRVADDDDDNTPAWMRTRQNRTVVAFEDSGSDSWTDLTIQRPRQPDGPPSYHDDSSSGL